MNASTSDYICMNIVQDELRDVDLYVFAESQAMLKKYQPQLVSAHQLVNDQFIKNKPTIISLATMSKGNIGRISDNVYVVPHQTFTIDNAFLMNSLVIEHITKSMTFLEALTFFETMFVDGEWSDVLDEMGVERGLHCYHTIK